MNFEFQLDFFVLSTACFGLFTPFFLTADFNQIESCRC